MSISDGRPPVLRFVYHCPVAPEAPWTHTVYHGLGLREVIVAVYDPEGNLVVAEFDEGEIIGWPAVTLVDTVRADVTLGKRVAGEYGWRIVVVG